MRAWLVLAVVATGCPPPEPAYLPRPIPAPRTTPVDRLGQLDDRLIDFQFDGGQLEFELWRNGTRITQIARNRYAVPMMIRWSLLALDNVGAGGPVEGVALLPAAAAPLRLGPSVVLAELEQLDLHQRYSRRLYFRARFGDPRVQARSYVYRLPYPSGLTFAVLQGFHGKFSHTGSNEYAVDFDCPVATTVVAARPGLVVALNAAAQGSGTTPEYLDYKRTNFILVLHDDGTMGEYMHLAPSGIEVKPGQRIERGQTLGLSGNTGYSSTPHLHFGVMTAGDDGVSSQTFPFQIAAQPRRVEEPVEGRRYSAWE